MLPHPDNETAELVVFLSVRVLKDVTIKFQTVALVTSGEGREDQPEFLVRLDFLLPGLRSSQPPLLSSVPRPFCGLSSLSSPSDSLLRPRSPSWAMQNGAPWSQRKSQGAPERLRTHVLGGRGWGVTLRRRSAPGSFSALVPLHLPPTGRTRKWRRRRDGGGEAARRWRSRTLELVWVWGRGAGLSGLGSLA